MPTIADLIDNLTRINLEKLAKDSLKENTDFMADLNREQLEEGLKKDDTKMQKYSWLSYARQKNEMNPKPGLGNPDLKLTGEFHKSIKYSVGDNINIMANDKHGLEQKYGTEIFGLGKNKKKKLIDEKLQRTAVRKLKEQLK